MPLRLLSSRVLHYALLVFIIIAVMLGFTHLVNGGLDKLNIASFHNLDHKPGWEAYMGDLPVQGGQVNDSGVTWVPYEQLKQSPEGQGYRGVFWVRRVLPDLEENYRDPRLQLRWMKSYQVYFDRVEAGSLNWENPDKLIYHDFARQLIEMPADYPGRMIHLRIHTNAEGVALGSVMIGEGFHFAVEPLKRDSLRMALTVCFLFLGFTAVGAYMLYNREPLHGYFALLTFCAGYSGLAHSEVFQLYEPSPAWLYFQDLALPLGTYAVLGLLSQFGEGAILTACRRAAAVMLAFTAACFILSLISPHWYNLTVLYGFTGLAVFIAAYTAVPLWRWINRRRDAETGWLAAGFVCLLLSLGLHLSTWHYPYLNRQITYAFPIFSFYWRTEWIYLGLFLFVLSLGMVIVSRLRDVFLQSRWLAGNLQEKNRQLETLNRLKDDFLANTSHELRTPLHGMVGLAEALLDGVAGAPDQKARRNLELIAASGKRLMRLVNDILDLAKLKHRDIRLSLEPVSLHDTVGIVLAAFGPMTSGKDVCLVNRIDPGFPAALADPNRLQQILYNLIGNAVKFTPSGEVAVAARLVESGVVEVLVTDTGVGIAREKLAAIFEPFEQAEEHADALSGTGLGLTLTRKLVELHGGAVYIRSEPGRGTECAFTLPVASADTAHDASKRIEPEPPAYVLPGTDAANRGVAVKTEPEQTGRGGITDGVAEGGVPGSTGGIAANGRVDSPVGHPHAEATVLLVDDESINMQVLINYLSGQPFTLLTAYSAEEALRLINRSRPDLVLLDIMLPDGNGYDICRAIRADYLPSELPVILLTAKNQLSDLLEGFDAGANDYITKPVNKSELIARVNIQLQLSRLTHSLEQAVRERTADLEQSNRMLQESLREKAQAMAELQVAEERNRIAGDIHDIVGHTLTTTLVQLEAAKRLLRNNDARGLEKLELSQDLVRRSMNEIRESVRTLRQSGAEFDLDASLQRLLDDTALATGIQVDYRIDPLPPLDHLRKKTIYRALQEGLTNSIRHGQCQSIRFELSCTDSIIRFTLWNDGTKYAPGSGGNGLRVMSERVRHIGGDLHIAAPEDGGCLLAITIPLEASVSVKAGMR